MNEVQPTEPRCSSLGIFDIAGREAPFRMEDSEFSLNSIFELFELVKQGKVCVQSSSNEANFFWNEERLRATAADRLASIARANNLQICTHS